jgi:hypothetical protein
MKIDGVDVQDVILIEINGKEFGSGEIREIHLPDTKFPAWEFDLTDGTTIYVTGNIIIHYRQ